LFGERTRRRRLARRHLGRTRWCRLTRRTLGRDDRLRRTRWRRFARNPMQAARIVQDLHADWLPVLQATAASTFDTLATRDARSPTNVCAPPTSSGGSNGLPVARRLSIDHSGN
jgi:hypothetical protein